MFSLCLFITEAWCTVDTTLFILPCPFPLENMQCPTYKIIKGPLIKVLFDKSEYNLSEIKPREN